MAASGRVDWLTQWRVELGLTPCHLGHQLWQKGRQYRLKWWAWRMFELGPPHWCLKRPGWGRPSWLDKGCCRTIEGLSLLALTAGRQSHGTSRTATSLPWRSPSFMSCISFSLPSRVFFASSVFCSSSFLTFSESSNFFSIFVFQLRSWLSSSSVYSTLDRTCSRVALCFRHCPINPFIITIA